MNIVTDYKVEIGEYKNPILNHPKVVELLKAAAKYKSASKLLELGQDEELAEAILEEVDSQGADKVMKAMFAPKDSKSEDLFKAIDHNDMNKIIELVSKDPSLVNATNADGDSPGFMANLYGQNDIANYLLQNGAHIPEYAQEVQEPIEIVANIHLEPLHFDQIVKTKELLEDSFNSLHLAGLLTMLMFCHHS